MKTYNWQQPDWPKFQYDVSELLMLSLSLAIVILAKAEMTENVGMTTNQFSIAI